MGKSIMEERPNGLDLLKGTCRDAMIRLREKNILDFGPASKGRWRGIRIEFTALGLEFLRKSQLLTKSASQNTSPSRRLGNPTGQLVSNPLLSIR